MNYTNTLVLMLLFGLCRTDDQNEQKFVFQERDMEGVVDKDMMCIKNVVYYVYDHLARLERQRNCSYTHSCSLSVVCRMLKEIFERMDAMSRFDGCDSDNLQLAKLLIKRELKQYSDKCDGFKTNDTVGRGFGQNAVAVDQSKMASPQNSSSKLALNNIFLSVLFLFITLFILM